MKRLLLTAWLAAFAIAGVTPARASDVDAEELKAPPAAKSGTESKQEAKKVKIHSSGTWKPELNEAELATLFAIAEDTLDWCVNKKQGSFSFEKYAITAGHRKNSATFVTLKIGGALRGCIGSLEAVEPLYMSVHRNAINAAMNDYRFSPVEPPELPGIEVDVSILSPNRKIAALSEFKVGAHGIILEKGRARSVFLPEVAVEQGWSREETLTHLSLKARLPADAWKSDATFLVFESCVITRE